MSHCSKTRGNQNQQNEIIHETREKKKKLKNDFDSALLICYIFETIKKFLSYQ
jgi:hypothetical protein